LTINQFVKLYDIYFLPAIGIWDIRVESIYLNLKVEPKPSNPLNLSEDIIELNRDIYYSLKSVAKSYVDLYTELSSTIDFSNLADSPLPTEADLPNLEEEILFIANNCSKIYEAHRLLLKKCRFRHEHILKEIFTNPTLFDSFYDEIKRRLEKAGVYKTMEKVDKLDREQQARSLNGMFWRTVQPYYVEKTMISFVECCVRSVYPNTTMIVDTSTVQPTISYQSDKVEKMYFREGVSMLSITICSLVVRKQSKSE